MTETRKGMLLVISGPSGTGKGALCEKLFHADPNIIFSVSYATRKARQGEIDGVHYHFVSDKAFDELVRKDMFLEYATVHEHRYGTPKAPIDKALEEGRCIVLDIDPQGARRVMQARPDCVSVFLLPPSYKELRVRLHTRNTDQQDEIERRLRNARGEVAQAGLYQYNIVNDDLDLAFEQLSCIVTAERHRATRFFPVVTEE